MVSWLFGEKLVQGLRDSNLHILYDCKTVVSLAIAGSTFAWKKTKGSCKSEAVAEMM